MAEHTQELPVRYVNRKSNWFPIFCTFVLLYSWSLLCIPIPGVSEPHYLGKAKHFWDPEWCAGDLLFESSNPHLVFYALLGWIPKFVSLSTAAYLIRGLGLALVACGWQLMSRAITNNRWGGVAALPIFLALQSLGNWSGEWLIGGAEGKVFSYGLLFLGIARWLMGRFRTSAASLGGAVSFHPIVGMWGLVVIIMATVFRLLQVRFSPKSSAIDHEQAQLAAWWRKALPSPRIGLTAAFLFLLCGLPGLIPAVSILSGGDPQTSWNATQLQVASRLAHHLDPFSFPKAAHQGFLFSIVIWWLLQIGLPVRPQRRLWTALIASTLFIAAVGLLIAWGPRPIKLMPGAEWRMTLLKFYPFRMADLFIPIAVSLAAAERFFLKGTTFDLPHLQWQLAASTTTDFNPPHPPDTLSTSDPHKTNLNWCYQLTSVAVLAVLFAVSAWIPEADKNPSRMTPAQELAWKEACEWLRNQTEPTEFVQAMDTNWGVKWFAERPEYVSYKDFPQDSPSIVEWNRRLWVIARWKSSLRDLDVIPEAKLAELYEKTNIHYIITRRMGPFESEPVFSNKEFRVYRLPFNGLATPEVSGSASVNSSEVPQ